MRRLPRLIGSAFASAAVCLTAHSYSYGQVSVRILHHFGGGTDGAQPFAAVIQGSDGMLYGTTENGGSNGYGTVLKLDPDGGAYAVIYNFGASETVGQRPQAGLVQGDDGALYGTTAGVPYPHTVFKVNPDGAGYTIIHSFARNGDGGAPGALVLGNDGVLYGTTMAGGSNNAGTVFKLNTDGSGYSLIYNFGTNTLGGRSPHPGLMQGSDGALYGTAGGGSNGMGVLFKLRTNGDDYTVLHTFGSLAGDGSGPSATPVQGSDGVLYGTTYGGGSNNVGTVFKLNTDGSGYDVLHGFSSSDGQGTYPGAASLVQSRNGTLYGTTEGGWDGRIFKLNTNGGDYNGLYRMGDAGFPRLSLMGGTDGALYGTAEYGGTNGNGTVFQLTIVPLRFTSSVALRDKTFQLSLNGASNATSRIDASADLLNWLTLTNILNVTGTVQFTDLDAPNFPQRFYRAVWVP